MVAPPFVFSMPRTMAVLLNSRGTAALAAFLTALAVLLVLALVEAPLPARPADIILLDEKSARRVAPDRGLRITRHARRVGRNRGTRHRSLGSGRRSTQENELSIFSGVAEGNLGSIWQAIGTTARCYAPLKVDQVKGQTKATRQIAECIPGIVGAGMEETSPTSARRPTHSNRRENTVQIDEHDGALKIAETSPSKSSSNSKMCSANSSAEYRDQSSIVRGRNLRHGGALRLRFGLPKTGRYRGYAHCRYGTRTRWRGYRLAGCG